MSRIGDTTTLVSGVVTLDAAADKLVFTPCRPVRITRFGYLITVEVDNTQALQLNLDYRPTAGSDTGRVEKAEIAGSGTQAAGKMYFGNMATPLELDADEQAVIEVSQAATAGDGHVFLEYQELPFVGLLNQSGQPDLGGATELTNTEP